MTYDGTNWVNVGNAGFSTSVANFTSLVFSPSDSQPYVAFQDWQTSSGSATVMKFDGINWVNVGNDRFSAGQAAFISLAFSPSGQPYVGFIDSHTNPPYKATVMKFDGANWVNVGNEGFSAGYVGSTSLAFSQSGQPYIAYEDGGNSGKATVMKFDGTNWVDLGNEGFSDSTAYSTCLAISQ